MRETKDINNPPRYITRLVTRRAATPSTEEMSKAVRRAVKSGWTRSQLCRIFDVHHNQITRWMQPRSPEAIAQAEAEEVSA